MSSWLQVTSGHGPAECEWVAARVADALHADAVAAGLVCELLEAQPGDRGGLSSALLSVEGDTAGAFAAGWVGSILWVGRSPFRPTHKRKNWFVGVECLEPPRTETWSADEIRVEVMRAGGPGGQHQNKTESAVRVTHTPSGLSAVAREERSQHRNKALALARLAKALENRNVDAAEGAKRELWERHARLERGNAVRVYEGEPFRRRS